MNLTFAAAAVVAIALAAVYSLFVYRQSLEESFQEELPMPRIFTGTMHGMPKSRLDPQPILPG